MLQCDTWFFFLIFCPFGWPRSIYWTDISNPRCPSPSLILLLALGFHDFDLQSLKCSCEMPVHIFSVSAFAWLDAMFFKWLGKRHFVIYDTKSPTPSANPCPPVLTHMTVLLASLHSHPIPYLLQSPLPPKTLLANLLFCCLWFNGFIVDMILFCFYLHCKKKKRLRFQSFWGRFPLAFCRVVQVKFAASGSTGRTSPSRPWCWTSPPARASSGPKRSWIASCRRSTLSPSRPTTAERDPTVPTWRSHTSMWSSVRV